MAKQANRMMIGGFVVIAVFILAASLVVFGSGRFFKKTETFVLFFNSSVKGLSVGAPVLFQGVQIGSVKSIVIRSDPHHLKAQIPVTIEIDPDKFEMKDGQASRRDPEEAVPKLIAMGLRAVLTMQSYITGQLMIELDFYPGTPVNLRDTDKDFIEIPTIQSTTERLLQSFQNLDITGLQKNIESTLNGIERLVNNPDLAAAIREMKDMLSDLRRAVNKVDTRIDPLADNLQGLLDDTRKLANNVDRQVEPLADSMDKIAKDFDRLARIATTRIKSVTVSLDKTMSAARGVMSEDSPLVVELETTLQEVAAAARAFRELSNYLERHPEALIQGKGEFRKGR